MAVDEKIINLLIDKIKENENSLLSFKEKIEGIISEVKGTLQDLILKVEQQSITLTTLKALTDVKPEKVTEVKEEQAVSLSEFNELSGIVATLKEEQDVTTASIEGLSNLVLELKEIVEADVELTAEDIETTLLSGE